jgi:hypothetical protein
MDAIMNNEAAWADIKEFTKNAVWKKMRFLINLENQ